MNATRKNPKGLKGNPQKTVGKLLRKGKAISRFSTNRARRGGITVVLLYGDPTHFDEGLLSSVPHVTLRMTDDLLQKVKELHEENRALQSLSLIDSLTGLGNKRFFWMQLETEMARTKRTGHSCTLMMVDLDNFKALNDGFGHLEGDRFLEEFGKIIRENCRSTDLPCRYGGDEFSLIMPATSVSEAVTTGNRLMNRLVEIPQRGNRPISLSIGIAEYTSFSSCDGNDFVRLADRALYEAKGGGKNQICVDADWREMHLGENEVGRDERDALYTNYQ
jgi:two-component system, cell cycle response regulator